MSIGLSPICFKCAHFIGAEPDIGWACKAFPKGIPVEILVSAVDHHRFYPGDGGIRFKPKEQVK